MASRKTKKAVAGAALAKAAQKQSQKQRGGKKRGGLLRKLVVLGAFGGAAYKAKGLLKPPAPAFPAPPAVPYVPPTTKPATAAPDETAQDEAAQGETPADDATTAGGGLEEPPLVQAADISDNLDTDTDEPAPGEYLAGGAIPIDDDAGPLDEDGTQTNLPDGASSVGGAGYPVKGNIRRDGTKIFHEPGTRYYVTTNAEIWFATPAHAIAAGYRAPRG